MQSEVIIADYHNPEHQQIIGQLMNHYAQDPMGSGGALKQQVIDNLAIELAKVANAFTVLAMVNGEAVGLINAMQGFSTFKCQPLINIHDVVVSDGCRGMGIDQKMVAKVEEVARQRGCCKLTL